MHVSAGPGLELEIIADEVSFLVPHGDESCGSRKRPDARDFVGAGSGRDKHRPATGVDRFEVGPSSAEPAREQLAEERSVAKHLALVDAASLGIEGRLAQV